MSLVHLSQREALLYLGMCSVIKEEEDKKNREKGKMCSSPYTPARVEEKKQVGSGGGVHYSTTVGWGMQQHGSKRAQNIKPASPACRQRGNIVYRENSPTQPPTPAPPSPQPRALRERQQTVCCRLTQRRSQLKIVQ